MKKQQQVFGPLPANHVKKHSIVSMTGRQIYQKAGPWGRSYQPCTIPFKSTK